MDRNLVVMAFAAALVAACGDSGGVAIQADVGGADVAPEDASGDTATDTADDVADITADVPTDVTPDTEPDVVDASTDVADAPDAVDASDVTADAPDAMDAADTPDTADTADVFDPPGGESCERSDACPVGFVCIDGVCQVPLAARAMAEDDFDILEPEEIADAFALIKSFAVDVKFMLIETQLGVPETSPVSANYGAAEIIDPRLDPITVRWQDVPMGPISFSPVAADEDPDGRSWATAPFDYDLSARVSASFGDRTFSGDMGFDVLDVVLTLRLDPDSDDATGVLAGIVTRAETERRTLMDVDEFPGFGALFCTDRDYLPDDGEWNLSDVFDCNGAPLDYDVDGDGELDAYVAAISATFEPVVRLP